MLAGSRRNVQPAGTSRQGESRRPAASAAQLELPPYEEPRLALTKNQQQKLRQLAASQFNAQLKKQTDESVKLLAKSVLAINERATNRREEVERKAKKRRGNNNDEEVEDDAEMESVRAKAHELKTLADPLTMKLEKALRDTLDLQEELEVDNEVLTELPANVATAQDDKNAQAEAVELGEEDDEAPEAPGVAIHHIIENDRKQKRQAYDALTVAQRYTDNNSYREFKRNWHEGLIPNDEIPVPDPKTWFDKDGHPQHLIAGDADDSDDEIQIAREVRNFRCPLSLVLMTEPYTCSRCKHSFQKEAILAYLDQKADANAAVPAAKKCPETGCIVQVKSPRSICIAPYLLAHVILIHNY